MQYGQDVIDEAEKAMQNGAQIVPPDLAKVIRDTRVAEQWERYDSVIIGPRARELDQGFFNSWQEFANADKIEFFKSRSGSVGDSYSNQGTERTDYAQDFYQTGIEFFAPIGLGELETDLLDQVIMPSFFVRELPNRMPFRIKIADVDNIATIPGSHAPSGYGVTGIEASQSPAPLFSPGQQGEAHVSNTWKWPEPVMVPAGGRIGVTARIDSPAREFLRELDTCPGFKNMPPCGAAQASVDNQPVESIQYPNWYIIRVFFRGPRYLQIRGARSAA